MTDYKFTYFNVTAKGETSRMLFALAGVKFEDIRLTVGSDQWAKLKSHTPFGQLPILEVGGVKLCQSRSIERLLAKRFGFYGATDLEQAKADMIVDCIEDMGKPVYGILMAEEEKKPEMRKKYLDEQAPQHLANLEKMVGSSGWFVGDKISWPDVACYTTVSFAKTAAGVDLAPVVNKNPKMKNLLENVQKNPKIAEWLANRPTTKI